MHVFRLMRISLCVIALKAPAQAQQSASAFPVPESGVTFLTGDSWRQGDQIIRLYGVQACLRGTFYSDSIGQSQDCGAVSTAMLSALVRDTKPQCVPVARVGATATASTTLLVVCSARIGANSLDLGTMLVTQGFAFAALDNENRPVYTPYLVGEAVAKEARAGLWRFADMPHPNKLLLPGGPYR